MYAARILLGAGYAPAGQLLFLACPSKSNQKERHPAYRPQQKALGVPCVARHAGRLRNSHVPLRGALLKQVLADFPRQGCATRRCTGAPKPTSTPVANQRFTHLILVMEI